MAVLEQIEAVALFAFAQLDGLAVFIGVEGVEQALIPFLGAAEILRPDGQLFFAVSIDVDEA